jgi:hypothetical protein
MAKNRTRDDVGAADVVAIITAVECYPGGASREVMAADQPRTLASRRSKGRFLKRILG